MLALNQSSHYSKAAGAGRLRINKQDSHKERGNLRAQVTGQIPKPMAFHKHSTGSAKVEPVPRKSLGTLPSEVVRPAEAALVLSVSLSLLKKWRAEGAGPRFVRLGGRAIGYRRADLSDWVSARIS